MTDFKYCTLPDRTGEDFTAHNEAARALQAAFAGNTPHRAPIRLNTNPRMLMLDPAYNRKGLSYKEYMTDPEVMGQCVLEWLYWVRFLLPGRPREIGPAGVLADACGFPELLRRRLAGRARDV